MSKHARGLGARTNRLRPGRFSIGIALAVVLASPATADVVSPALCRGLADFALSVAARRNQGASLQDAVSTASRTAASPADPEVAAEIALQIYLTPKLSPVQEAAAIYAKCSTPLEPNLPPEAPVPGGITGLEAIPLQRGTNTIPQFGPSGRPGRITLNWRDEGGGHGHDEFLVEAASEDGSDWQPVRVQGADGATTGPEIVDNPNNDTDMLRSVRFARAEIAGQGTTLLITATRPDDGPAKPSLVDYDVYSFSGTGAAPLFTLVAHHILPLPYCNADIALSAASGLALRSSYRGPRNASGDFTKDGCPAK